MDRPAAIEASFSDFKLIKSRSVAQIVCEVAIEHADNALAALGGIPLPGKEQPIAIARLLPREAREAPGNQEQSSEAAGRTSSTSNKSRSEQGKAAYAMKDEMEKAVTRAALLCDEAFFQDWIRRRMWGPNTAVKPTATAEQRAELAAQCLRAAIGVSSRREIASKPEAFEKFKALELEFAQHSGRFAQVRG
jgi:hypothetical protein